MQDCASLDTLLRAPVNPPLAPHPLGASSGRTHENVMGPDCPRSPSTTESWFRVSLGLLDEGPRNLAPLLVGSAKNGFRADVLPCGLSSCNRKIADG